MQNSLCGKFPKNKINKRREFFYSKKKKKGICQPKNCVPASEILPPPTFTFGKKEEKNKLEIYKLNDDKKNFSVTVSKSITFALKIKGKKYEGVGMIFFSLLVKV